MLSWSAVQKIFWRNYHLFLPLQPIYEQTGLEMNFLLATLLELELTGTVENIGGQIYRLRVELEIPSN